MNGIRAILFKSKLILHHDYDLIEWINFLINIFKISLSLTSFYLHDHGEISSCQILPELGVGGFCIAELK